MSTTSARLLRSAAVAVALVAILSAPHVFAADGPNLLANPSFEQAQGAGEAPASWQWGKIYGNGPTHFELATGKAATGDRAVRMTSLHATQFVRQSVEAPAGQTLTFRVHGTGSGKLRMIIQPLKDGHLVGEEVSADWTLTDRWLEYSARIVVPECDLVRLMVITPGTGMDVWLDDASAVTGADIDGDEGDGVTPSNDLIDVTPISELHSVPYAGVDLQDLSDGDIIHGGLHPAIHPGRGARFSFRFERPVTVAAVEFAQAIRPAWSYLIDADTDGDGSFDRTLVRVTDEGVADTLIRHVFEPTEVHAVRFCGLQGIDRYGRTYPILREFRVLAHPTAAVREDLRRLRATEGNARPSSPQLHPIGDPKGLPTPGDEEPMPPAAERTLHGVFIAPWMFGLHAKSEPPFEDLPALDAFLWKVKYLCADHVWLVESTDDVIWPSDYVDSLDWDALTPMTRWLEDENILTFPIFGRITSPPYEEGGSYRELLGGLLREVAERGAHGASLCADEYPQCGGGPEEEAYTRALQEELGIDERPPVREDTEAYRRWMLFHYRYIGRMHRRIGEQALAVNPDFIFTSNWRVDPVELNETYGSLAYDILGEETGVDYFGTDPYFSDAGRRTYLERTAKMLTAAGRPRGSMLVLKGGSWEFEHLERFPGILINGNALASVMHGASGVSFYRMNYLFINNKSHLVREAFRMIDWLDEMGLPDTRTQPDVAVLHSRASEDFWQLRQELDPAGDLKIESTRGYIAQQMIQELLLRDSYPFDVIYLDREEQLADLGDYKVVVLPFPYSISDEAVAAVEAAHEAGANILICEHEGEADQVGTLRETPALAGWAEREGVEMVENLVDRFTEPAFREDLLGTLDGLLGGSATVTLDSGDQDIEAILRRGEGHWLLAVVNWDPDDVQFDLGLHLPQGTYTVTQCDGYGIRPAGLGDQQEIGADALARMNVQLERGQVRVYDIRPAR